MTNYMPDLDERSEFPSEDEPYVAAPVRAPSWLFTATLAVLAAALFTSSLLLS